MTGVTCGYWNWCCITSPSSAGRPSALSASVRGFATRSASPASRTSRMRPEAGLSSGVASRRGRSSSGPRARPRVRLSPRARPWLPVMLALWLGEARGLRRPARPPEGMGCSAHGAPRAARRRAPLRRCPRRPRPRGGGRPADAPPLVLLHGLAPALVVLAARDPGAGHDAPRPRARPARVRLVLGALGGLREGAARHRPPGAARRHGARPRRPRRPRLGRVDRLPRRPARARALHRLPRAGHPAAEPRRAAEGDAGVLALRLPGGPRDARSWARRSCARRR